jgi:hypothetical protein
MVEGSISMRAMEGMSETKRMIDKFFLVIAALFPRNCS